MATYTGQIGHTYSFYCVATDNVGNRETEGRRSRSDDNARPAGSDDRSAEQQLRLRAATYGQTVTLTATVQAASGTVKPTGSIQLMVDGAAFGAPAVLSNGAATFTLAGLGGGDHTLVAAYAGVSPSPFRNSQATLTIHVTPVALTVTANNASKSCGAADPAFSAAYAGFIPGEGPGNLKGALVFSTTEPSSGGAPVGSYKIVPAGLTSTNYTIQFVAGTLSVVAVPTSVSLSSSASTAVYAQPVTLTAKVLAGGSGSGVASGSSTFFDGGTPLATVALDATGTATLTLSALALGNHTLTAGYSGDAQHAACASPAAVEQVQSAVLELISVPGQQALFVGGTAGNDVIKITPSADAGQLTVAIQGQGVNFNGDFTNQVSRIVVYGGAGDDHITVARAVKNNAWLFGGDGNDVLTGGGGPTLLVGGAGNDRLKGGTGRDILIGAPAPTRCRAAERARSWSAARRPTTATTRPWPRSSPSGSPRRPTNSACNICWGLLRAASTASTCSTPRQSTTMTTQIA